MASDQDKLRRLSWGRVLAGGVCAELAVFAIVFPVLHFWGQTAFLVSILVASAVLPFLFALWVDRRVESHFALHRADGGSCCRTGLCGCGVGTARAVPLQSGSWVKARGRVARRDCCGAPDKRGICPVGGELAREADGHKQAGVDVLRFD
jgi:hypothetical protein